MSIETEIHNLTRTVEALVKTLEGMRQTFISAEARVYVPTTTLDEQTEAAPEKAEKAPKPRPARKAAKAKKADPDPEPTPQPEVSAADVVAALRELKGARDSDVVRELLKDFDATSVSGLSESDYAAVIKQAAERAAA